MPRTYRSRRARLAALRDALRAQGWSWTQIAVRIAREEHENVRVAFRLAHGMSQRDVAERYNDLFPTGDAGITDKQISYWETWPQSGHEPSLRTLKRLAQLYQCDVGDLIDDGKYSHLDKAAAHARTRSAVTVKTAAAPQGQQPSAAQGLSSGLGSDADLAVLLGLAGEGDEDIMKRRAFLMSIAALAGLRAAGATTALETIRHGVNQSLAERHAATDIDEWREIALEYGQTYPITAPGELLSTLMVDLYGLQAAMQRYPNDTTQRELRYVGAMLTAFTAQTLANMGYLKEARRWWRTARRAADESGDQYCILWIRGREIVRAGYEGRPLTVILQLIEEAEARIDRNSPLAALPEFLSGKAQTLALMGQPASGEVENTLNRVRGAFSSLPLSVKAQRDSIFAWGEERLRFTESLVYTYLGDFRRADAAQTAALALYPADDLRSPAQVELQRALCLIGAGDVRQGIDHAQGIITNLPAMHRVRPVADLGHKVLKAVPVLEQPRAGVQEYRECIAASFAAPPAQLTA